MGNGPELFETPMGRRFYESTLPDIATALLRIAGALEKPAAVVHTAEVIRDSAQAQNMLGRIDETPARPNYRSIRPLLDMLADAGEGECFCRLTLDPDGPCPCAVGDCDGCSECPSGKARSILVAMGLA